MQSWSPTLVIEPKVLDPLLPLKGTHEKEAGIGSRAGTRTWALEYGMPVSQEVDQAKPNPSKCLLLSTCL